MSMPANCLAWMRSLRMGRSNSPILNKPSPTTDDAKLAADAKAFAESAHKRAVPEYAAADIGRHVKYLCRDELEGRFTGSRGEQLATAYVAAYMEKLGLKPAGDDGGWFQQFEFTSGVALGPGNELTANGESYQVDKDWRPLSFSGTGEFESAPLVFAGYGIVADAAKQQEAYDSYVHLDVKDKWVVVFRYLPEDISPEKRQQLNRPSQLRFKTTFARERGARGLIVVTGPNAESRSELVPLQMDGILAGSSLPVISVTNDVADSWLAASGKSLKQLQDELDDGAAEDGLRNRGRRAGRQDRHPAHQEIGTQRAWQIACGRRSQRPDDRDRRPHRPSGQGSEQLVARARRRSEPDSLRRRR